MMLALPSIDKVSLRLATEADQHLKAYDNTKLVAINTCPTFGILRYSMHKSMAVPSSQGGARQLALECGSACHDVFAAVRLWQLREYQQLPDLADFHGYRLFGTARYEQMLGDAEQRSSEDQRVRSLAYCLSALESSGYYDDPRDRRRTLTNMEEACIAYIDRWDWNRSPVWVRDPKDPKSDIGVELPFDLVIRFELDDGTVREYRFIGKADGLHTVSNAGEVFLSLHENKTASRLDDAWRDSFQMSSQVTGYCLALGVWAQEPIERAEVFGLAIPLPRAHDFGGVVREVVYRNSFMFERWFEWFLHTVMLDELYHEDPIKAPKYTHSCNRYFRPCMMIPFCTASDEDQLEIISEMYDDEWNPLHEEKGGD